MKNIRRFPSLSLFSSLLVSSLLLSTISTSVLSLNKDFFFSKSEDPLSSSELSQSVCFKRVLVSHFLIEDYSLPGSAFVDPAECDHQQELIDSQNQIRTSLTTSSERYRLPTAVYPKHYELKICPQMREPFNFSGSVEIELEVLEATSEITLNLFDLEIESVSLWPEFATGAVDNPFANYEIRNQSKTLTRRINSKFKDFRKSESVTENNAVEVEENQNLQMKTINQRAKVPIISVDTDEILQRLIIKTDQDLSVNRTYKLKISFIGNASNDLTGLYKTFHHDANHNKRYSLVTQFQVSAARKTFPCFDEPGFQSEFSIALCREKTHTSISNMPKRTTVPRRGHPNMVWDFFERSVPMSTYLVAFAILDGFDYAQCNSSSTPFKVWAPSSTLGDSKFACEVSPKLLEFFEDYFMYSYPLPKMDFLALPQFFALGMENWGLVTFLWNRILVSNDSPTLEKNQQESLETISHEMAHQWFGNLVTPSWWSEIWLNEGFATFLSLIGLDYIRPSWQKTKDYVVRVLHSVLGHDSMESSHPIVVNVSEPKEFFSLFDSISYGKGCFLVRMLMHILGEKAFQNGLQRYLKKLEYMSASQDDLWHYMTEAGLDTGTLLPNFSIAEIMDTWVVQEGYPVVNVVKTFDGHLALKQKRHYQEPDEAIVALTKYESGMARSPKWWIPVSMTTERNRDMNDTSPKFWLNSESHIIQLDESLESRYWFVLNVQQTGFFRVNYDRDNWMLLVQQLRRDHIVFDDITRAQMIDDSFALAFADSLEFEIPLSMISYLNKEQSAHVLAAALENLKLLLNLFSYDAMYGEIKDMILSVMAVHYPRAGILNRSSEKYFERETKNLLINTICKVFEPCIAQSKVIFDEWKMNPTNFSIVPKEIFGTVFCTIISEGGEAEWRAVWDVFYKNIFTGEHTNLLLALSCTRHLWLNSRLLLTLSADTSSFAFRISLPIALNFVAQNPISLNLAWEFLQVTWPRVVGTAEDQVLFDAVVPHLRTESQYKQLLEFVATSVVGKTTMHETYVRETLKNVNRKINFQSRNYDELFQWFVRKEKRSAESGDSSIVL